MILTLSVAGFRGVVAERRFRFADITLLSGRNGLGKTTVFEAIDWCLFGDAERTNDQQRALRNLYSQTEPHVTIEIEIDEVRHLITRGLTGASLDGSPISDRELAETLVSDPEIFPPYSRDLEQRVRRLIYLRQDEIRSLLYAESLAERASVLQSILGIPGAELLASSLRKIEQRISERLRISEDRAREVDGLMQEVIAGRASEGSQPFDVHHVLLRASDLLGEPLDAVDIPTALDRVRDEMRVTISAKAVLEAFLAFSAEARARLALEARAVDRDRALALELSRETAHAVDTLAAISGEREAAEGHHHARAEDVERVEQALQRLRARLAELQTVKQAEEDIASHSRDVAALQAQVVAEQTSFDSADSSLRTQTEALSVARLEYDRLNIQTEHNAEAREAVIQAQAIETSIQEIETEIATATESIEQASAQLLDRERALAELRRQRDTAAQSYSERLDALLAEIVTLVEHSNDPACPL